MSTWPLVKFVDSPSTSATVRFDCNDRQLGRTVASFDPGVPTLEGDPNAVGQTWGFRAPSIAQRIKGTKAVALAALSALAREQLRHTNWVMFQLDNATSPVWFKTYATGYQPLTLDRAYVRATDGGKVALPDTWEITVPLVAEPFAYGARVVLPTVTVANSLSASNSLRYVLPAIKGDAPTGLRVKITPQGAGGYGASWLVGCIAGETSMTDTVYDIGVGDGMAPGSAMTSAPSTVGGTSYLGGSYRTWTNTTTISMVLVLQAVLSPVPAPGRYRVLLRCELDPVSSSVPQTYGFRFAQLPGGYSIANPDVFVTTPNEVAGTAYTFQGWVDLGESSFPVNQVPVPADVGVLTPASPLITLSMNKGNSAALARIDAIKLIPIDGPYVRSASLLKVTTENLFNGFFGTGFDSTMALTVDADETLLWKTLVSGGAILPLPGTCKGGYPIADPAAPRNLLFCFPTGRGLSSSTTAATAAASTWNVDISYYPRYLHIGDGS